MVAGRLLKSTIACILLALVVSVPGSAGELNDNSGGSLKEIEGISLVTMTGSAEEMGNQHSRLLGKRFEETEMAFAKLMPPMPGGAVGKWLIRQFVMLQLRRIEGHLTEDELSEMKGIAEAFPEKNGSYRDILYYHVLQDIGQNYACTGAAAAGRSSRLAGPIVGRNFDMDYRSVLEPIKTIFYCRPQRGLSFVSIAWPGMVGAVSGMNERGLCVMVFSAKSEGTRLSGVPVAFMAKRLLKDASDIDEAVELIKNMDRMGPNTFLLADRKKVAAVEFDSDRVGVISTEDGRIPLANHFVTKAFVNDNKNMWHSRYSDSRQRYSRIKKLVNDHDKIGVGEMLSMLRDHRGPDGKLLAWGDVSAINNIKDAHSVIFDPAGLRFWVSKPPYAYGRFVGFRITGNGLTEIDALPSDAYPESADGKRAMLSDMEMAEAADAEAEGAVVDSVKLSEKALAEDPGNYLAALRLGEEAVKDNNYKGAYEYFNRAVLSAPDESMSSAKALAGRGEASLHLKFITQAKKDFDDVLQMDCDEESNNAARKGLGRYLSPEVDFKQAFSTIRGMH